MEIQYLGHSSFLIKTNKIKIVCDPFKSKDERLGLKYPTGISAEIVTVSHNHYDHNCVDSIKGNPYIINEPGEFEIKGVNIFGIKTFHDQNSGLDRGNNTVYVFESEELSICHLGDLGHVLSTEQVNELNDVDILLIPVGGKYTIDAKMAAEVVSKVDPKIIIPMHYSFGKIKLELDTVDTFIKEMGIDNIETTEKLVIKGRDTLPEEMQIVKLVPKS